MCVVITKICNKCNIEKSHDCFYKSSCTRDKLRPECKECSKIDDKKNRDANKDERNKKQKDYYYNNKDKERNRKEKYYKENKDKVLSSNKIWEENNKERRNKKRRENYSKNKEKFRQKRIKRKPLMRKYHRDKQKHYRKTNPMYSIRSNLCRRLNMFMKEDHTLTYVGCDIETLKSHICVMFDNKMTWDNYGKVGWHVDHIIPCSFFDLHDEDEIKVCFNYKNLRPLWYYDNQEKGDTIIAGSKELLKTISDEIGLSENKKSILLSRMDAY